MKKFEVPYNFNFDFVERFKDETSLFPYIKNFYMPAWKDDCDNTRYDIVLSQHYPVDYRDYLHRIEELKALDNNIPINILMQRSATLSLIEKYNSLGITSFTINDDKLADTVKNKYGDNIELILSVTRSLTDSDLQQNNYSMYDEIVLWTWFNRHLDTVKDLPKNYKYILLCNARCPQNCYLHNEHWFLKADSLEDFRKKENDLCGSFCDWQADSIIWPNDLQFFDPYIKDYKITDRQASTYCIIRSCRDYMIENNVASFSRGIDYYNIKN